MVIVFTKDATEQDIIQVIQKLTRLGLDIHRSTADERTMIRILGDKRGIDMRDIETLPGVMGIHKITDPYLMVGREYQKQDTRVTVRGTTIGGKDIVVMAGPCTLESKEQITATAQAVADQGIAILRGGAFKPRTSPYSFQGLGFEGLKLMRETADSLDMAIVSELLDIRDMDRFVELVDIIQVGARNMHNFPLLKALGQAGKPVLLKRGMWATIEEWLLAAEYILYHGNMEVILCERGIRAFESQTRFTLDLASIPIVKRRSHLPIMVDPSHASGNRQLVVPMARAAVAAGADGLLIEVHYDPRKARCDGAQSLYPGQFAQTMEQLEQIARAIGRTIQRKQG